MRAILGLLLVWVTFTGGVNALGEQVANTNVVSIQGIWRQGELLFGRVAPDSQVEILGHRPLVMPDGKFVFGLDRDAPAKVILKVTSSTGQVISREYAVATREYAIQRLTGVADKYVNPPPAVAARIAADARLVAAARKRLDPRREIEAPFIWPVAGPVSGVFGSQRVYNGKPSRPHYGLDIAAPVGTMVRASQAGVVTLAADLYFSGGTIILDHGQGVNSTFMHLSKTLVKPGQVIKQGDPIGEVGATGRVTGPHLDWRMNWFDQRLDVQRLIPPEPQL